MTSGADDFFRAWQQCDRGEDLLCLIEELAIDAKLCIAAAKRCVADGMKFSDDPDWFVAPLVKVESLRDAYGLCSMLLRSTNPTVRRDLLRQYADSIRKIVPVDVVTAAIRESVMGVSR